MAGFDHDSRRRITWNAAFRTHVVLAVGLTPLFVLMAVWGWYANVAEVDSWNGDGRGQNSDYPTAGLADSVTALPASHAPSRSSAAFRSIASGHDHACGVLTSGEIVCWGRNDRGQATPPDGEFKSVSAGRDVSCGIRADGRLTCWGLRIEGTPKDTAFRAVSVHDATACGITLEDSLVCWSSNTTYRLPKVPQADGPFQQVSVGNGHACALNSDGLLLCWGRNEHGQANAPPGAFRYVSAGDMQTCGIRTDDTVDCWGSDWHGRSSPPPGTYRHVATLWDFSCGVRTDGTVVCWGFDGHIHGRQNTTAPRGNDFQTVATGGGHACALKTNGTVVCWGIDHVSMTAPAGVIQYEPPLPVTNIEVCSGPSAGEVVISWDAAPRATHYRIGHVNMVQDYPRATASVTGEWIEAFTYVDVNALNVPADSDGRARYTLRRLAQGDEHAFTVLTSDNVTNTVQVLSGTYFWPQNPRWRFLTVAALGTHCGDTAAAGPTENGTDRDTLIALYHSLDGPNWRHRDNWLSDGPLSTWQAVTVDADDRVVRLDLGGNSLRGPFPVELAKLASLGHIDLSSNPISGELPPELGSMVEMDHLNLHSTRITGAIPPELGHLINLYHLSLAKNRLSGPIPPELGNLRDLRYLWLDGNQLTGAIPPELGNLTELEILVLKNNQLTGSIPPELGNLPRLRILEMSGNPLTGCIPTGLRRFGDHGLGLPFC